MNSYNGFTPHQRMQAFHWLKDQIGLGRRAQATQCDICGQTRGILELHSEDYSAPYGPHIGAYQLCYCCHMVIHCRTKNPAAWARYRAMIAAGQRLRAFFSRDFQLFCQLVLRAPTPERNCEPADGARLELFESIETRAAIPPARGKPTY